MSGNYSPDVDKCDLTSSMLIQVISFIVTIIQAITVTLIVVTGLVLSVFLACVLYWKRNFIQDHLSLDYKLSFLILNL